MRVLSVAGLILALSISARAQSTVNYQQSASVVDSSGNLIVFDSGYTVTTVATTGSAGASIGTVFLLGNYPQPVFSERIPTTRITVLTHGATTAGTPVVYSDASVQVVGVGTNAAYALVTLYSSSTGRPSSQEVVAINGNLALPGALTGFPTLAVGSGVNIELGPAVGTLDYLSLTTPATSATATVAATPRTAKVYSFGTAFALVSQGTLP